MFGFDVDSVAGTLFQRGKNSFFGRILGEDAPATGHWTAECTRSERGPFTCTEDHVWHLEDGRLLKFGMTYLTGLFPIPYTGFLLDPPGLRLGARRSRR